MFSAAVLQVTSLTAIPMSIDRWKLHLEMTGPEVVKIIERHVNNVFIENLCPICFLVNVLVFDHVGKGPQNRCMFLK